MPLPTSPSTQLYQLGKGILYIGDWVGATPPTLPYTDVGNCPRFEVEVTEEKLAHYSSRSGTRTKDKEVVLEAGYNVAFDLDEISMANLAKFLKGTISGYTVLAQTVLDKEYGLQFISDNPVGQNETWTFWRCTLSPGGTFSLIGDEWAKMSFTGSGLADTTNHATSPYFTVEFVTTTSTTTTTA